MTPGLTSEEAEAQLRVLIANADIQDEKLDQLREQLPKMRTSDLFCYLTDHRALLTRLGILHDEVLVLSDIEGVAGVLVVAAAQAGVEHAQIVTYAASLAIKDEIDRRFPIPEDAPLNPRGHAPLITQLRIIGCTCGWETPPGTADSETALAKHYAIEKLADKKEG